MVEHPALVEPIIDAELPIVDAHHHLWLLPESVLSDMEAQSSILAQVLAPTYRRHAHYLIDEFIADLKSGHNVRASVHVDAHTMYRASGPEAMKSVGEVEFVNGAASMAASGIFGDVKACAGIVGGVDLSIGDAVEEVLMAHIQAGGGRYRGVRSLIAYDDHAEILGPGVGVAHLLLDKSFRAGFGHLHRFGLSFDAWVLEPQLPELIELARAFPTTRIVLEHVGTPIGVGPYAGQRENRFASWRNDIRALSRCNNVTVKLSGFGLPLWGFESYRSGSSVTSEQLATAWTPYIETCIEAFGVDRCMFASNFPVDSATCGYAILWNAFKRVTARFSRTEKAWLYADTAKSVYQLAL